MTRYIIKLKPVVLLLVAVGGLSSLLLSSCASGGGHSSTNPAYYDPNSKVFPDNRWPFGNGGYR
ncbi:MAG: hypothetical protein JOZ08_26495 [Verrucomicrobia bacterium]|nr:hypothetical protein [Verrucomicrobiota bacterium]MBV8279769.1 hypothetical protein [Verrucomicrobiota bacterium]